MRRLTEADREAAIRYAAREPDYNLFILGDILNHGLDGDQVEAFVVDGNGNSESYDALLLRYRNSYVVCSHHDGFRADLLGTFLRGQRMDSLCGKAETVEKLLPWFPDRRVKRDYLSVLTEVAGALSPLPDGLYERMLAPDDADAAVELYAGIEEFAANYVGKEKDQADNLRFNLANGGRGAGVFDRAGCLAAIACTSAENPLSAMIVGVATRADCRRMGLATRLVSRLCRLCLDDGLLMLCLFYDNPDAGSIYRRIGFRERGGFTLVL